MNKHDPVVERYLTLLMGFVTQAVIRADAPNAWQWLRHQVEPQLRDHLQAMADELRPARIQRDNKAS
jgi:hypothetical protein